MQSWMSVRRFHCQGKPFGFVHPFDANVNVFIFVDIKAPRRGDQPGTTARRRYLKVNQFQDIDRTLNHWDWLDEIKANDYQQQNGLEFMEEVNDIDFWLSWSSCTYCLRSCTHLWTCHLLMEVDGVIYHIRLRQQVHLDEFTIPEIQIRHQCLGFVPDCTWIRKSYTKFIGALCLATSWAK